MDWHKTSKGSCVLCGDRATTFCVQCTFIHNLPRGTVACCASCFPGHVVNPKKKKETKAAKAKSA